MTDIVDKATRSRMMSGIRGKNTKPEILIRKALHRRGFRYRLHASDLPGKPDIVLPRYGVVIFIHGCFWHGHDCKFFKLPSTRTDFWNQKISGNRERDRQQIAALQAIGWRTLVVWECVTRKGASLTFDMLIDCIQNWLIMGDESGQLDAKGIHVQRQNQ